MDKQLTVIAADTNVWKDNLCDKQERLCYAQMNFCFLVVLQRVTLCKKFPRYCYETIMYADTVMKYFATIFLIQEFNIL